jgi:LPS export ABC transporter permease LptG/LPS export ABC transporter permease LptF
MLRTLDRYVIRETVPPFLLSLLIFTFILEIPPVMDQLESLVAKGVSWRVAGRIILTLIPQGLGLTIPMALLTGLLIGLGRMSADREAVALLACGVSPYRLLRPVAVMAVVATAATTYVLIYAIPDANQKFRDIAFEIITKRVESDVRPRVFFEDFPGYVLYARDEADTPGGGWKHLFVADTSKPDSVVVQMAAGGQLVLDRGQRRVDLVLRDGVSYSIADQGETQTFEWTGDRIIALDPDTVFRPTDLPRGITEKTIAELRLDMASKRQLHHSPHPEIHAIHHKFSIPAACLVFAVIGLALGLTVAREGKLAGFVLGIAVIFTYYIVMYVAEGFSRGLYNGPQPPDRQFLWAHVAPWLPNLVLGLFGIAALVWRARFADRRPALTLPFRVPHLPSAWRRPSGATPAAADSAAARRNVVVVVRFPRVGVPAPGLLDRYISRLYVRIVGLSFLALLGLFYIATVIDRSDKLFKGQASTGMLMELLAYRTPQFVYYVIPIAALLSVLVTFGVLSRTSELTVMKACGISLYRAALPIVLLSLVGSIVLFGLEQEIMARSNRQAEVLDSVIRGRPVKTFSPLNRRWIVGRDGSIYHYGYFDPDANALTALTVYTPDAARWRLARQTYAARAEYRGEWIGLKGWTQEYSARVPTWDWFAQRPLPLEPPEYFETEEPIADLMTVGQLRRFIDDLSASGFNVVPLAVELQRKLAFPFVTFVMTLLAVPFGVTTGRRGTLYGIGLGIVIALSYWFLVSVFVAIGKAGLLSPMLAGWTPNIIVVAGATYMFLTART